MGKEGYYCGENLVEFYRNVGIMEDFKYSETIMECGCGNSNTRYRH